MFDRLMELDVDGLMISPGYPYEKAPDQEHFLARNQTKELFREILDDPPEHWTFNHSQLFLDFLKGEIDYDCTPWGNPTRTVFGWQRPCYLMDEGYTQTFKELIEETEWANYGVKSGKPQVRRLHGPLRLRSQRRDRRQQQHQARPPHPRRHHPLAPPPSEPLPPRRPARNLHFPSPPAERGEMPKAEGGPRPRLNSVVVSGQTGPAPLCHSVTSPPAERGERRRRRDNFFSTPLDRSATAPPHE